MGGGLALEGFKASRGLFRVAWGVRGMKHIQISS